MNKQLIWFSVPLIIIWMLLCTIFSNYGAWFFAFIGELFIYMILIKFNWMTCIGNFAGCIVGELISCLVYFNTQSQMWGCITMWFTSLFVFFGLLLLNYLYEEMF